MTTAKRARKPKTQAPRALLKVEGVEWCSQAIKESLMWLIRDVVPANASSLMEGRKGSGKSTILAAIAAAFTGGPPVPGWEGPREGRVMWLAREDAWASVVCPRLEAAGANLERIGRIIVETSPGRSRPPLFPQDLELIEEKMAQSHSQLLIVDPLPSMLSSGCDVLTEQGCRAIMDRTNEWCDRAKVTVIFGRHLRKSFRGDVRDAGYGHGALGNCARSIFRVDLHPHELGRRLWSVVACNSAGATPPTQSFEIDEVGEYGCVVWTGPSSLTAQQIAEGDGDEISKDEWGDAELILAGRLERGWAKVSEIQSEGEDAGVSKHALRRACKKLGCQKRRIGFGSEGKWEWGPPKGGWPEQLLKTLASMRGAQKSATYDTNGETPQNNGVSEADEPSIVPLVAPDAPPPPHQPGKEGENGRSKQAD